MSFADDLRHALDAATFAREALGLDPDGWQADVLRSASSRLLLNCSRQSGKSTTAAALAVHRAVFHPRSLVLLVSPSLRQSSEMYRRVRDLAGRMPSPPAMSEDTKTSATLRNGSRIVSLPSSEATIRGYSAVDLLIFDEASRVTDALYYATRPMLATSAGSIVGMSTPWGRRGWWYEAWEDGVGWERVRIPATDCPRIPADFLAEERRSMGPLWYASEYECQFVATVDSVFDTADIEAAISADVQPLFGGA
jgi:hypothetical protein